jgi:transposase
VYRPARPFAPFALVSSLSSERMRSLPTGGFRMKRYGLRDDQFARIEQLLPGRPGYVGRDSERGNRLFVDAVIWNFRSGAPWRDLPERFGPWKNIHTRFSRWAKTGVWEIFSRFWPMTPTTNTPWSTRPSSEPTSAPPGPEKRGLDQAIGRSRGGLTTKIYVVVDALGNPLALSLTGGQAHDITQAETLIANVAPDAVLGDKGYDSDGFIASLERREIEAVILPRLIVKQTRVRLRPIRRTQPDRTFLPVYQTVSRRRHAL